ncbi:MAG: hypothetical protein KDE15_05040 [Erythrobacter sp.]|nr:hypothetical protein [Erythrobacter sp.]
MKPDFFILAPALLLAASCSSEPEVPPQGTVQQLMAQDVQPTAEVYWNSVGAASELVDGEPVFREWQPETDAEWAEVRTATQHLQELGELLQTPAYADGRGDNWMAYARGLVDAAKAAEQTVEDRDTDAILNDTGYTLYRVCDACHRAYPPEELAAEGATVDDVSTAQ